MMREISEVKLYFNNLDNSVWIPMTAIKQFKIKGIHKEIVNPVDNFACEIPIADTIEIELEPQADQEIVAFSHPCTLFERVRENNDLSSVGIKYANGSLSEVYSRWADNNFGQDSNILQNTEDTPDGIRIAVNG